MCEQTADMSSHVESRPHIHCPKHDKLIKTKTLFQIGVDLDSVSWKDAFVAWWEI